MEEACTKLSELYKARNFDFFNTSKSKKLKQLEIVLRDCAASKDSDDVMVAETIKLLPRIILGCLQENTPEILMLLFIVTREALSYSIDTLSADTQSIELVSSFSRLYKIFDKNSQERYYTVMLSLFNKICNRIQRTPSQELLNFATFAMPHFSILTNEDMSPRILAIITHSINAGLNSSTFYKISENKITQSHFAAFNSLAHKTNSNAARLLSVYRNTPAEITDPFLKNLAAARFSSSLEIASIVKKSTEKALSYPGLGIEVVFTAYSQSLTIYDLGVLTVASRVYLECRKESRVWAAAEALFIAILCAKNPSEYNLHSDYIIGKIPEAKGVFDLAYAIRAGTGWTLVDILTPGPFLSYTLPWCVQSFEAIELPESCPPWIQLYCNIAKSIDTNNFNRTLTNLSNILKHMKTTYLPFAMQRYFLLLLTCMISRIHVLRGSYSDARTSLQHALVYAENLSHNTVALLHSFSACLNLVDFPKPFTSFMSINCYNINQGGRIAKGKAVPQLPENENVKKRLELIFENLDFALKYSTSKSVAKAQAYLMAITFFYSSIAPSEITLTAKLHISHLDKIAKLFGFSASTYEELYSKTSKLTADTDFQQVFSKFNSPHLSHQAKLASLIPKTFKGDTTAFIQCLTENADQGILTWIKLKTLLRIPPKTLRAYSDVTENEYIAANFGVTQKLPLLLLKEIRSFITSYVDLPPRESFDGCPICVESFIDNPELHRAANTISLSSSHEPLSGSHCTYQPSKLRGYFIISTADLIISLDISWNEDYEPYEAWRVDPGPVYAQKKVVRRGETKEVAPLAPANTAMRKMDRLSSLYVEYHRIMEAVGTQLSQPQGPGWWTKRASLDEFMAQFLRKFEADVIGPFGFVFRANLVPMFLELAISKESHKLIQLASSVKLSPFAKHIVALTVMQREDFVELDPFFYLNQNDFQALNHPLYKEIISILDRQTPTSYSKPIHLVMSTPLCHLPVESIPSLRDLHISRLPSKIWPLPTTNEEGESFYLLNPDGSIKATEERILPYLKSWRGVVGEPAENLLDELNNKSVYLFCGHGIGAKYIPIHKIDGVKSMPVALLMGCSSVTIPGNHMTSSVFFRFLLGRSRAVIGTLVDVTDLDIDKLTIEILKSNTMPVDLLAARKASAMTNLTGAMTVSYGMY